jgi:hypothetical protein
VNDPIAPGTAVRVHYNLHKGGFSVVSRTTGRVVAWVRDITLTEVTFRVQPSGLARIRREHCRAVCAYAVGTIQSVNVSPDLAEMNRVTFNPYRADEFTRNGEPIHSAPVVTFADAAGWTP